MTARCNRQGASTVESLLMAAFIALVMLAAVSLTGDHMKDNFQELQREAPAAQQPVVKP